MEQQTYEREIDLVLLVKQVMEKFKTIVIAGIIGAVVIGLIGMTLQIKEYNDPEAMKYHEESYRNDLNTYNAEVKKLNREIDNLNTSIERQEEYNEKSILMKINPFDVQKGVVQYYVDTDYQINPDITYQSPDYTDSVLNAYAVNVNNGGLWKYLYDNMEEPVEFQYLKELVSVSVDYGNDMINVNVTARTEADCKELLILVKKCFDGYHAIIDETICEHDMSLVTESIYSTVDLDLEDKQRTNTEKVEDYTVSYEEKKFDLAELLEEGEPAYTVPTSRSIVTGTIKYAIIGGVVAAFAVAAVICVMLLLDTTIKYEKDVAFYLGLPVLAEIPVISGEEKVTEKLKKSKKDRLNQYGGVR